MERAAGVARARGRRSPRVLVAIRRCDAWSIVVSIAAAALLGCGEAPRPRQGDSDGGLPPGVDANLAWPDGGRPDGSKSTGDGTTTRSDGAAMHPAIYPAKPHSPITPYVAANLRKIRSKSSKLSDRVFAKIGASATVSRWFLHCFDGTNVKLAGRTQLSPTVTAFRAKLSGSSDSPYTRTSLCATVGWSAGKAISGSPSPMEQEVAAISPRFAVIMYGTNDIQLKNIFRYADNMLTLADKLIARGVIPLITTIPPRDDSTTADAEVPRYNAVLRAVAQARQVPLIGFHDELAKLSGHGLGSDGIHPNVYSGGACVFDSSGLRYGYNIRNLLTIQSLHRVVEVVVRNKAAPDSAGPALQGKGTYKDPWRVTTLPFVHVSDTRQGEKKISRYTGCSASQDESGPERVYQLQLKRSTKLRAMVFDRGTVDIDLHLLGKQPTAASCIERDHQIITRTLSAGTYHLTLDTFVKSGKELSGEYLLVLMTD